MESFFLLPTVVSVGLFVGWIFGVLGLREARRARREIAGLLAAFHRAHREIAELRAALQAVGKSAPPDVEAGATIADVVSEPNPQEVPHRNPWVADTPQPAKAEPTGPGLEALLTLRWGTWLGAATLMLAAVFLIRLAIEEGWLGPALRCFLTALLGLALLGAAEWLRRRPMPERSSLPWPDQAPAALAAGGVAALFGAAYAAVILYALVSPLVGFALMGFSSLAGIALALRYGPLVAAVGIIGAYTTPALVETRDPWLLGLFAYLLLVTAAAQAVLRFVAAAWLGWTALLAAALWVVIGGFLARSPDDLWAPALFVPAATALHLGLLPSAALDGVIGRRLAWLSFIILALAGLILVPFAGSSLGPAIGILFLTPVAVWKGAQEPRLDRLSWLAATFALLMLLVWPIGAWTVPGERVTIEGVVQTILPGDPWPPTALMPFLLSALALAVMNSVAGSWFERRAIHGLRWAALTAAVPVLVLLVAYARVSGFASDLRWGFGALALAAGLITVSALARPDLQRAGAHAAGAVAALSLGVAMVLSDQWLTLAIALFLPPLAWIEARANLRSLRLVAIAVAGVVLVRLLLNPWLLDYNISTAILLNGFFIAYGVPAASFVIAATIFLRRGDDLAVAVLEAGAVALATALFVVEVRHAIGGGEITGGTFSLNEAAWQLAGLALFSTVLRALNRRLGNRVVLRYCWQAQLGAALVLGVLLLLQNPLFIEGLTLVRMPVLNELLLAYALPAVLAGLAARAPETADHPSARQFLGLYTMLASFAWITLEVRHVFQPDTMIFWSHRPSGAELYAYSGAWLVLAGGLFTLGVRAQLPALRLAALGIIATVVAKAFLVDMSDLVGLWRVLSFLGLGLSLIALSWVYRRFVVEPTK